MYSFPSQSVVNLYLSSSEYFRFGATLFLNILPKNYRQRRWNLLGHLHLYIILGSFLRDGIHMVPGDVQGNHVWFVLLVIGAKVHGTFSWSIIIHPFSLSLWIPKNPLLSKWVWFPLVPTWLCIFGVFASMVVWFHEVFFCRFHQKHLGDFLNVVTWFTLLVLGLVFILVCAGNIHYGASFWNYFHF